MHQTAKTNSQSHSLSRYASILGVWIPRNAAIEMILLRKTREFASVKFPPEIIKEAYDVFRQTAEALAEVPVRTLEMAVDYKGVGWVFDNLDEFYSEYRNKEVEYAHLFCAGAYDSQLSITLEFPVTTVSVTMPNRADVEKCMTVFEGKYDLYKLSGSELERMLRDSVKVFIGHGRSEQWRYLKDHLQDKQGFEVVAYEVGARAGYTIAEVLDEMSEKASIAFLIHTAEDEDKEGQLHARENTIHETGLFQGKLGRKRAIVILEDGCNEYTNLAGIQQLRYSRGNIKEVFGDVISILYREFATPTQKVEKE